MLNGAFWAQHFRATYIPNLLRLIDVLEQRLLPTFDAIDEEARARADAVWEQAMSSPGDPDFDPSVAAENAFEAGFDHYSAMSDIRQSLLNIYASALYHAWEQQLLEFFRREVLPPAEEHRSQLFCLPEIKKRLAAVGVNLEVFSSWEKIDELRLLANTVKHADGKAADALRQRRPDLFEPPDLKSLGMSSFEAKSRVYTPFSGDDIFVSLEELRQYCSVLSTFWKEFEASVTR